MDPRWLELADRQKASGFADFAGTRISATIPIGERLINEAIAASLPSSGRIRAVQVTPLGDNRLSIRVSVAKPSFLPPITVTVHIERQPALPASSDLVLRLEGAGGLLALAGPALALFDSLPPGVLMRGEHIHVDVKTVLEQRGLGRWLPFVERLQVTTQIGRVVLSVDARIPPL